MDEKIFISPSKYVQGRGVLDKTGEYVKDLGKKALLIADEFVWGIAANRVADSLKEVGLDMVEVTFEGESSEAEIKRIVKKPKVKVLILSLESAAEKHWTQLKGFEIA